MRCDYPNAEAVSERIINSEMRVESNNSRLNNPRHITEYYARMHELIVKAFLNTTEGL